MALALQAELRGNRTKGQLRRLRASGKIPGIAYGNGFDSVPLVVDEKKLHPILAYHANSILELDIPGRERRHVLVKAVQKDCIVGHLEHIDFRFVRMHEEIRASVRVEFVGDPVGAKNGIRTVVKDLVEVKCMPASLPEALTVDVSDLDVGGNVLASQLEVPEGVELLTDGGEVLLLLSAKQKEASTAQDEAEAAELEASAGAERAEE
ncbi:50S ribosomal protein L25 [Paenibacillus sp. TRM 82003]|nr:50S ribosomal protein L25 [Paenibacillus sp. TRM 82003]